MDLNFSGSEDERITFICYSFFNRNHLFQIPNSGFEEDLTNWTNVNISLSINTSVVYEGLQSLDCSFTRTSNSDLRSGIIHGIQGSTSYTLSVWFFDSDPAGRGRPVIEWYNSSDMFISSAYSGAYSPDQSYWQKLTFIADSPADAAGCKVGCRFYDVSGYWDGDCTIYIDLFTGSSAPSLSNNYVLLSWQTASEINNYGFEVQKLAPDSPQDWKILGFVQGNGNSNIPVSYFFTDRNITVPSRYQYRLKHMDTDGNLEYSKITEAEYNPPLTYGLGQNYPNRSTRQLKFHSQSLKHLSLRLKSIMFWGIKPSCCLTGRQKAEKLMIFRSTGLIWPAAFTFAYSKVPEIFILKR